MGQKQFTTREGMHRSAAIVPGDPGASPLIRAIRYETKIKMPPAGKLTPVEIAVLEKWVRDGADWPAGDASGAAKTPAVAGGHWALQPVKKPEPPPVKDNDAWVRGAIDRFVLAKLEEKRLPPAPDADRYALLRRLTLDLTGLLPTAEDVRRFASDESPAALESVVDRLLGSPAFGERWGRHWLDVTYWADTTGVGRRIPLREAWRYRDYVIRSFAADKPYDRFLREQIAGPAGLHKEKDGSKEEALTATGFLVLGPWAWFAYDKVQTRADMVDLQVDLIGRSVMGLTLGCARCHDHKFDPVTNKDYFALAGIFLSTKTTSRASEEGGINEVRLPETAALVRAHADAFADWEKRVARVEAEDKVFKKEQETVRNRIDELKKSAASPEEKTAAIQTAEKELAELKKKTEFAGDRQILLFTRYMKPKWPSIYAAEEMELPENARIAARGDAHQLGDFVPRGFLSAVSIGRPAPEIDPHSSGRKELADWLTDPGHPLTARVYVTHISVLSRACESLGCSSASISIGV
jgi:hypothetical protein